MGRSIKVIDNNAFVSIDDMITDYDFDIEDIEFENFTEYFVIPSDQGDERR